MGASRHSPALLFQHSFLQQSHSAEVIAWHGMHIQGTIGWQHGRGGVWSASPKRITNCKEIVWPSELQPSLTLFPPSLSLFLPTTLWPTPTFHDQAHRSWKTNPSRYPSCLRPCFLPWTSWECLRTMDRFTSGWQKPLHVLQQPSARASEGYGAGKEGAHQLKRLGVEGELQSGGSYVRSLLARACGTHRFNIRLGKKRLTPGESAAGGLSFEAAPSHAVSQKTLPQRENFRSARADRLCWATPKC